MSPGGWSPGGLEVVPVVEFFVCVAMVVGFVWWMAGFPVARGGAF